MQYLDSTLLLSPTDLANHLACRHLTELDRATAEGRIRADFIPDPRLEVLQERGLRHELAYIDRLLDEGRDLIDLRMIEDQASAAKRVIEAMRRGAGMIVQAALRDGRWRGRADVLLRVDSPDAPTDLGPWSYEVVDTKLARETRGSALLQLCLYSEIVGTIQGRPPRKMYVVKPGDDGPETDEFLFDDFAAYYRMVRRRLEAAVDGPPVDSTYPEPVPHCDICNWWQHCDRRRRRDDHLSLVAGMQSMHRGELERQGVATLAGLATRDTPLPERPKRGSLATFDRLHEQARIQKRGRDENASLHELLPVEPDRGLALLPEPSPGDVYLDFEGDQFVEGGGLEYLAGVALRAPDGSLEYRSFTALERRAERRLLEALIDLLIARFDAYPAMHIYHFAPYEPAAIKRMMGRHATREIEVDRLLRGKRFVDLHAVVRQGMRAGVERYSLKELEPFCGYERELDLREAGKSLRAVELALELHAGDDIPPDALAEVEAYNRDDCLSTAALHAWLETLRSGLERGGTEVPRPTLDDGDAPEALNERELEVKRVFDALVAGVAEDPDDRDDDQRARWLLAHMLDYFRREDRCVWWEYFRMRGLEPAALLDERKAVAGLRFVGRFGGTDRCPVHRYSFPPQEVALSEGDSLHRVGVEDDTSNVGTVHAVDHAANTIDVKKRAAAAGDHLDSLFAHMRVLPKPLDTSLLEVARSVIEHGVDGPGPHRAARDLLLRRPPRQRGQSSGLSPVALRRTDEDALGAAARLAGELDDGLLAIQGPPGSGKTFTGARMIATLANAGARIGVTAVSHKVIRNLLGEAIEAAADEGSALRAFHKPKSGSDVADGDDGIALVASNDAALGAIAPGSVVGGTCWLWARDDAAGQLDYLFIDEAGQLSLAQAVAASRCARNIVLLGDPQQLEQPQQGSHPEGSDVSALQHLLGEADTIRPDVGLFLDRTWRLHPKLCEFTSKVFYEGRLQSREGLERQALHGVRGLPESGLVFVPVEHSGNQNSSDEEVLAVCGLVERLTRDGVSWTDSEGEVAAVGLDDVLIVAPYNAQVGALCRALPEGARVGTVDKFQGQQAAVVIYSMASSSAEDAPRGLEFLFDPHRLNVATSRARALCLMVGSSGLLSGDCRTVREMRWVNGVCSFLEGAVEVSGC